MAERVLIETERLWTLAKEGKSAEEIMAELGVSDRSAVKQKLTEMMRERGERVVVPGLIGEAELEHAGLNQL
jgi:hypothetical protein